MEDEMYFDSNNPPKEKKIRHRKKQLYASIREKMEFYFSDANLLKDRFLGKLLQQSHEVDLEVFLKFNRIHQLTENAEDIAKSLRKSEFLKLTEDRKRVYRTTEVKEKENIDECTIYVEQLTPDAKHDWIIDIFSKYGKVDYVSVPRYKHSGQVKGFAFVEFATAEGAKKALEAFTEAGCCLTSQMNPEQLCSINTFESIPEETVKTETEEAVKTETEEAVKTETEENTETIEEPVNVESKKRKKSEEGDEVEDSRKKLKTEVKEENEAEEENTDIPENTESSEQETVKKKKNRKKKKSHKQKFVLDIQSYGLHILPKVEWKRLRNKYLNLQREKMAILKQQLNRSRSSNQQRQLKTVGKTGGKEEKQSPRFVLIPGLIVKVTLEQPLPDQNQINKFKAEARCLDNVMYVDVQENASHAYVRLETAKAAEEIVSSPSRPWENMVVLTGNEEKEYWDKIKKDREEKFVKKIKTNKRGKTKLIYKAEKVLSKRIRLSVDE